jgi:hypothetical protein
MHNLVELVLVSGAVYEMWFVLEVFIRIADDLAQPPNMSSVGKIVQAKVVIMFRRNRYW